MIICRLKRAARLVVVAAALAGLGAAPAHAAKTVWLCKPGIARNPCTPGLSTTVYTPSLQKRSVTRPTAARKPAVDCFYVYPTVSDQKTTQSNLHIEPVERSIALYQVARYSQYCRVYAPMYRQVTLTTLTKTGTETAAQLAVGYGDVRNAWRSYLKTDNHGRGVVFIGHSQGSFVLRKLIAQEVDPKPAVRRRLLSAILLGGNVEVKRGSRAGGDFKHVPACRSARQLGCVVAFSTFDTPVLADSKFGRPPKPHAATRQVLCTNPAALRGGSGLLDTIFPSQPFTPGSTLSLGIFFLGITQPRPPTVWVDEPNAYRAKCSSAANANVLQLTAQPGAQTAKPSPDGTWGLHLVDANIALGNLVDLVRSEAAAFVKRGP